MHWLFSLCFMDLIVKNRKSGNSICFLIEKQCNEILIHFVHSIWSPTQVSFDRLLYLFLVMFCKKKNSLVSYSSSVPLRKIRKASAESFSTPSPSWWHSPKRTVAYLLSEPVASEKHCTVSLESFSTPKPSLNHVPILGFLAACPFGTAVCKTPNASSISVSAPLSTLYVLQKVIRVSSCPFSAATRNIRLASSLSASIHTVLLARLPVLFLRSALRYILPPKCTNPLDFQHLQTYSAVLRLLAHFQDHHFRNSTSILEKGAVSFVVFGRKSIQPCGLFNFLLYSCSMLIAGPKLKLHVSMCNISCQFE